METGKQNSFLTPKNVIITAVIGGLLYFIFKKRVIHKAIDKFQQKNATKDINELLKLAGPTFKKKRFLDNTKTTTYSDEQIADSFQADGTHYNIYFFAWYTYKGANREHTGERMFKIMATGGADDPKGKKTLFLGTWKTKGNKIQMKIIKASDVSPLSYGEISTAIKQGKFKQYSGTIQQILDKATNKKVVLDSLAKK